MARDKLAEIAALRARGRGRWRGKSEIEVLQSQWQGGQGPLRLPPEFVPIRLVTILEVFTRDWVAQIIDSGEPYIGRAVDLVRGGLKIDFAMAQALVGKQVTFGELISHEIPVNGVGDVDRVFSQLLDRQLFLHLEAIVDRWAVEVSGMPATPIMRDPAWTRAQLAQLFETRHIAVHELPDDQSVEIENLANYVRATSEFLDAADQAFSTLLHGSYPLTQFEMNADAGARAQAAEDELAAIMDRLDPAREDSSLWAVHAAWEKYCHLQAEYRSGINDEAPGSIAPMLYAYEVEAITKARIEQLEQYMSRSEGEI